MKTKLIILTLATLLCLTVTSCSKEEEPEVVEPTPPVVEEVEEKEKEYLNVEEVEIITHEKTLDDVVSAHIDEDGCLSVTYNNGDTGYIVGDAYNETLEKLKGMGFLDEE